MNELSKINIVYGLCGCSVGMKTTDNNSVIDNGIKIRDCLKLNETARGLATDIIFICLPFVITRKKQL